MLPKSQLDAAKAFLCWDIFADLSIQLVPIDSAAGYYYPPGNRLHSIVLFYNPEIMDYTEPFFLLFHEAGHARQWQLLKEAGRDHEFLVCLERGTEPEKTICEQEAWGLGEELLKCYINKASLDENIVKAYAAYGRRCRDTYWEA